jgi:hypothetical protein
MSKKEDVVKKMMKENGYALSEDGKSYCKKGWEGETVYVKNQSGTNVPLDPDRSVYVEVFDEKVGDYTDKRHFEGLAVLFEVGYDIGLH